MRSKAKPVVLGDALLQACNGIERSLENMPINSFLCRLTQLLVSMNVSLFDKGVHMSFSRQ